MSTSVRWQVLPQIVHTGSGTDAMFRILSSRSTVHPVIRAERLQCFIVFIRCWSFELNNKVLPKLLLLCQLNSILDYSTMCVGPSCLRIIQVTNKSMLFLTF